MKLSEKIWVEKLAQASLVRPCQDIRNQYVVQQYMSMFLDELCFLVVDCVCYFNEIVSQSNLCESEPPVWSLFKMNQPRLGLIATRAKDKLVISDEGTSIHIKMLQCHVEKERTQESLYFDPKASELGTVNWRCANDGQYVNPELVVKNYLSTFFVYGCRGLTQTYPKLVAVGGGRPLNK